MAVQSTDTPELVCKHLKESVSGLSDSVFEALIKEKIDGEAFFELDEDCLKEITPCLGDRLKLKKAIRAFGKLKVCS